MAQDLSPYDLDISFLRAEFAKWWKIPTMEQIEYFCERVSYLVQDDEMSENDARKITFEKMIYK